MGVEETDRYLRIRIRSPSLFKPGSIRTHDVGRRGFTKRLAGRLRKNNKWATQAWLFSVSDARLSGKRILVRTARTAKMIRNALNQGGYKGYRVIRR